MLARKFLMLQSAPVPPPTCGKLAAERFTPGKAGMDTAMRRVAVFGNAGGGKSTLAKRLAEITGLPFHPLDLIQYKPGGGEAWAIAKAQFAILFDQRFAKAQA